jgi:hypothetical protein
VTKPTVVVVADEEEVLRAALEVSKEEKHREREDLEKKKQGSKSKHY